MHQIVNCPLLSLPNSTSLPKSCRPALGEPIALDADVQVINQHVHNIKHGPRSRCRSSAVRAHCLPILRSDSCLASSNLFFSRFAFISGAARFVYPVKGTPMRQTSVCEMIPTKHRTSTTRNKENGAMHCVFSGQGLNHGLHVFHQLSSCLLLGREGPFMYYTKIAIFGSLNDVLFIWERAKERQLDMLALHHLAWI